METMATDTVCPKCGGTGFIIVEGANVSGAKPCDCRFQGRAERMEERSQIPPLYRNASFDNFGVPGPDNPIARRDLTNVLLAVKNFVRDFPNETRPGLLLIGEPGTGKTHLAVAALRKIIEKGFECLFCDYQNLLDRIRAGFDPASNSSNKRGLPRGARCRSAAARRSGRAPRHRLGGGHRHLHHHLPLQQPESR